LFGLFFSQPPFFSFIFKNIFFFSTIPLFPKPFLEGESALEGQEQAFFFLRKKIQNKPPGFGRD